MRYLAGLVLHAVLGWGRHTQGEAGGERGGCVAVLGLLGLCTDSIITGIAAPLVIVHAVLNVMRCSFTCNDGQCITTSLPQLLQSDTKIFTSSHPPFLSEYTQHRHTQRNTCLDTTGQGSTLCYVTLM